MESQNNWLDEKDTLRRLCADLIVDTLWNPEIIERHIETDHHVLHIVKRDGVVIAILKKK